MWYMLLLFFSFLGIEVIGTIVGAEIDRRYLGIQVVGGPMETLIHILYYQVWGGIITIYIYRCTRSI